MTQSITNSIMVSIVVTFVVVGVITVGLIWFIRRSMFGQSRAKQDQIARLQATGHKARAMILSVQPTGTIVNHIYLRSVVRFRLDPIDGAPSFETEKTIMLAQTNMPRVGDVWPAWFDPANPSESAVAQVNSLTSDQIPLYREFGIPHPLDNATAAPPPAAPPPAAPPPAAAPPPDTPPSAPPSAG
jgi:enamine deaminase RidA (YjgF/YER057c/UK114 family)